MLTTAPVPSYPEPPEVQIRQTLQDIASLLSEAELDAAGLRSMTLIRMNERLVAKGYSQAQIEWAVYRGLSQEFLVSSKLMVREAPQISSYTKEVKNRNVEHDALAATNKIWLAWKTGEFLEPVPNTGQQPGSIVVAFSGGGLRAALFQLGIVVYLQSTNRLSDLSGIVAVSGGSILAGHLVKNWTRVTGGHDSFVAVAHEFVAWTQLDIRNNIVVKWLWSWWSPWLYFRGKSLTGRLRLSYDDFFGTVTLGDLRTPSVPHIAIAASDSIRRERVVFTSKNLLRLPVTLYDDEKAHPRAVAATGIPLAFAVTASSCFPPIFRRIRATHEDFGLTYSEFQDTCQLNDGGVAGNLGVEVLLALRSIEGLTAESTIVCDAERRQTKKPFASPLADKDLQAAALSQAARKALTTQLSKSSALIRFSERTEGPLALSFAAQTTLFGFRTDLDAPNWPEVSALLLHGAAAAANSLGKLQDIENEQIRSTICSIIKAAGGPDTFETPTRDQLRGCNGRKLWGILGHAIVVFGTLVAAISCFSVIGISYLIAPRASRDAQGTTRSVNATDSGIDSVPTPIRPPADFPPIEMSTFVPLNDLDRQRPGFAETVVVIENRLSRPIELSFAYVRRPLADGATSTMPYSDRLTSVVSPNEVIKEYYENFGGPVHISIFVDGKWIKTNEWFDLKVVPSRKVTISEANGRFRIQLDYEESPK
jgi:predicted acylesterase/phospholipase RssA